MKQWKRRERWAAYEAGIIKPQVLIKNRYMVRSLVVGLDGKIYSGAYDYTFRVCSHVNGHWRRTQMLSEHSL